jgi:hypothetical protein
MNTLAAAGLAVVLATASIVARVPQQTPEKREALKAEIAVVTLTATEVRKFPANQLIEHDPEVARGETLTIVVSVQSCDKGAVAACRVSADVVTYRPDGTIHSEWKGLSLNTGRATVPLAFVEKDATGIHRVVATVRDLNARHFAITERIFGVK